ncbi:MAG: type II secretion system F family protein [Candidatus Omnitrophica bacterium]|nr:type II secretion system F family protein [Candidatus Omnitrophota bacterium]
MYWRAEVLTKTGKELSLHLEGPKDHVLADLQMGDLTVITMTPDMVMALKKICTKGLIPSSTLGPFFIDFSRMLQSGLSINETARTLGETTADLQIKTALKSLLVSLNDGHSLKTAFENTKVFPHIVPMLLDAAERSGQIPEVSKKIGEYFEYLNENTNKVIGSFIYPIAVFIVLTVASIVVSMNLIPQLGFLLSDDQKHSVSMKILTGYA